MTAFNFCEEKNIHLVEKYFSRKTFWKVVASSIRHEWEDNIKMGLSKITSEDMD
jgi:hypothetical protein